MERIKKEEEMRKKKEQEDSLTLEQTKEQVNSICRFIFMCFLIYGIAFWLCMNINNSCFQSMIIIQYTVQLNVTHL